MRGVNVARLAVPLIAALVGSNCSDTSDPGETPHTGELRIVVSVSGSDVDSDGFSLVVDGSIRPLPGQATTFTEMRAGEHNVRLEGLAANCQAAENPRTVTVAAGRTTVVEFAVVCTAMGTLSVKITSAGEDYPAAGYWLSVDDGRGGYRTVGANGTATFQLLGGTSTLELTGTPQNCTIADGNRRTVTITSGETTEITFIVTCVPTHGVVRITTVTIGTDPDRNGYSLSLMRPDTAVELTLPTQGTVQTRRIRQGAYEATLQRNTVNCQVTGDNPRLITVTAETLDVRYEIFCEPVPKLAFDDGDFGDLWIINAQGEGKYRLFPPALVARQPRWSPDGRKIVFTSRRDGNQEIYVGNADGSGVTRLTNSPGASHSAAWSPDGSRIVFVEANSTAAADPTSELYVMNADGSNLVRLTSNNEFDGYPDWSPLSNQIAFTVEREGNRDIYVMTIDGLNVTRITTSAEPEYGPAWSPDGRKLAFARTACHGTSPCYPHARIILSDAAGGNQKVLAPGDAPAWSPDGRSIAYNAYYCDAYYAYYYDSYCTHSGIGFMGTNGIMLESNLHGFNPSWHR